MLKKYFNMATPPTCPTHNLTCDFVPEGVSKKGSRYNAFYSCPVRECKYSQNIAPNQGKFLSMQAEFRRSKEISYFNSLNAAIAILGVLGAPEKDAEPLIRKWRDFFYEEWQEWYMKNIIEEADETTNQD